MATNVLCLAHESIGVNALELPMRVYVDLSNYWPQGLSVNAAYEDLLMQGRKVDRRTLAAAKAGALVKSEYVTLVRLRDWVRHLTGDPTIAIEDLLRMED